MARFSATTTALVLFVGISMQACRADDSFFRNRGPMPDSLRTLLNGEGETTVLAKPDALPARGASSGSVARDELELPALVALPQHDCHIEVQVTERVRGHCSALTLMGKSFPVCKNGDRISANNHECAHMAA
ncbi:uncharacterized protein LOC144173306 [Haemaphysalis longicornis]